MNKRNERIAKAIIDAGLESRDLIRLIVMISECALYNSEHGYSTSAIEARDLFMMLHDYADQNGML